MAANEEISDTIYVSNLHENVTILQLVEQFGMIGNVKVSTVEPKSLIISQLHYCYDMYL